MTDMLHPSEEVYWKVVGVGRKGEEKAARGGLLMVNGEQKRQ